MQELQTRRGSTMWGSQVTQNAGHHETVSASTVCWYHTQSDIRGGGGAVHTPLIVKSSAHFRGQWCKNQFERVRRSGGCVMLWGSSCCYGDWSLSGWRALSTGHESSLIGMMSVKMMQSPYPNPAEHLWESSDKNKEGYILWKNTKLGQDGEYPLYL